MYKKTVISKEKVVEVELYECSYCGNESSTEDWAEAHYVECQLLKDIRVIPGSGRWDELLSTFYVSSLEDYQKIVSVRPSKSIEGSSDSGWENSERNWKGPDWYVPVVHEITWAYGGRGDALKLVPLKSIIEKKKEEIIDLCGELSALKSFLKNASTPKESL